MFVTYEGKEVQATQITKEKFESLVRDAKRVMGIEPTKGKPWEFLEPTKDGVIKMWAQRILALEWPVLKLWIDGHWKYVSSTDLEE